MDTADSSTAGRKAFSIAEFCRDHSICKATFYNWLNDGKAPRVMRVGGRVLISVEAAAAWRAEREAATQAV
jgi:predicted DNA-binding transcriptional regulator AlpA